MPTYEYECEPCSLRKEVKERYEFGPACDQCGLNMKRVWSAPGIQFKGTGWGGSYNG